MYDYYATGSQFEVMMHDIMVNIYCSIYLYFECMLLGTIVADAISAKHEPDKDKDFIIILGCAIQDDGTPTPLLQGRIDRALQFYNEQLTKTNKKLVFITSGGQGSNEIISEARSMKNYLITKGIDENQIIEEDKSTTTYENMYNSKQIIDSLNNDPKVIFSTTNYHVFRSGIFSRRVKMKAQGIGAKTKWYFWPNAAVREFVGLLTKHIGKQLLILGLFIIFYVSLTIIIYTHF